MPALAYLRKGYLVEAVINYIMMCGWAPSPDKAHQDEIYSIEELTQLFDLDRMQKTGARYDQKKFDYINGKHIRNMTVEQLADRVISWAEGLVLKPFITDRFEDELPWEAELKEKVAKYLPLWKSDFEKFKSGLALERERIITLSELAYSLEFLYVDEFDFVDENWNTKNHLKTELATGLEGVLPKLDTLFTANPKPSHEDWEAIVRGYADELGWKHGDLFMALRSAITGRLQSPPLLESIEVMCWAKAKKFVDQAVIWLKK
jgi:glutamyl-tRNA synthetase